MKNTGSERCYLNCSYIPIELFAAAGLKACRPWPQEIIHPGGDLLPYDCCPYSRALLEVTGAAPAFPVLADCCDAMRRVYDQLIPHVLLLEIPRRIDEQGVNYFYKQLQGLVKELGMDCRSEGFRTSLWEAIKKYNGWRRHLRELREGLLQGSGSFSLLLEGIELYYQGRGEELAGLKQGLKPYGQIERKPRILLISSTLLEGGLINLIENTGLKVVGLDSCPGERSFNTTPGGEERGSDPLRYLAGYYLSGPSCPRMMEADKRLEDIEKLFTDRAAEGIIYFLPKFCDQAAYDFKLIKEAAAGKGLPVLQIEGEYHNSQGGQLKTRVTAFRESLLLWRGKPGRTEETGE